MQSTWNQPSRNANPWQLGPSASRLARWVFGLGFFSVHLGVFLIGGLALLMLNLYRSPDDLWVGGPLIRWGVVVLIHFLGAVITWAFTTAFDAAEATRQQPPPVPGRLPAHRMVAASTQQQSNAVPPSHLMPPMQHASPRRRFSPARSTPAPTIEVEERKRVTPPREPVRPSTAHRASPPGWTVVHGDNTATRHSANRIEPVPSVESEEDVAEEARWTWVEAAAEAWLTGRNGSPTESDPAPGSTERKPTS
jgi:hypothetical protein